MASREVLAWFASSAPPSSCSRGRSSAGRPSRTRARPQRRQAQGQAPRQELPPPRRQELAPQVRQPRPPRRPEPRPQRSLRPLQPKAALEIPAGKRLPESVNSTCGRVLSCDLPPSSGMVSRAIYDTESRQIQIQLAQWQNVIKQVPSFGHNPPAKKLKIFRKYIIKMDISIE